MRLLKFLAVIILLLLGAYTASMYFFVDENKDFTIERQVDYPLEKVYSQFDNLQNFTRWNNYFSSSKTIKIDYYSPYEGEGSAISYTDPAKESDGEMFIRFASKDKGLRYQLFEDNNENPTVIEVKFKKVSENQTHIKWMVHTPKLPVWTRVQNFWTEDRFTENINKSMVSLKNVLGNKVEKDNQLAAIKYDSIMVEKDESQMLLGINVSASNKKDALYRNLLMNFNKVYNFVTIDLGKKDDEFGFPVMIADPDNFKDKEISYYLGIPLSKKEGVTDNNFSFRTVNGAEKYIIYYRGSFESSVKAVQQLVQKAKKDEFRYGDVSFTFIEPPVENQNVNLKISLSVFK
ncbi:SRPBCC family protein [Chryseobacterium foetidum]|uniref:polyketide cyclase n=1 Tax=Chryseobacterium foetidum TaxID=2951057 RepID=UPI0021CA7879|nr:polyketide cyclase [Chryseobacterium foetidum]